MTKKVVAALACAAAAGLAHAEFTSAMTDPLEWKFDDSKTSEATAFAETDVPVGGVAEADFLFNGLVPGRPLAFSCDAPGGEWFRMVPVSVEKNTGLAGFCVHPGETNQWAVRVAPYREFEALAPLGGGSVAPDAATFALRFQLRRFAKTDGETTLRFRFEQDGCARTHELKLRVHPVRLVDVGRNSFKYTNWFDLMNMATRHGLQPWSEAHFDMIGRYARLAAAGRQNCAWIPLGYVFEAKDGGVPALNEERLVRLVDIYTAAGIWWIEGGHICNFNGGWGATNFLTRFSKSVSTTPDGVAAIRRLAEPLAAAVERHGWKDRWIQHVADEPDVVNATEYRMSCAAVRRYMPGFKLLDAVENCAAGAGALDILCPKIHTWQTKRAEFDFQQKSCGDGLWCYTCCVPGGKWLNRTLDWHLLKPLYVFWGCSEFGIDGFLHWGYNMYQKNQDPFGRSTVDNWGTNGGSSLPPGDTHVVYPGADGPWSGARFEATRQGVEDYELLALVKRRDPARATALTRRLVRAFDDYTVDVKLYRRTRRELLESAAPPPPGRE